MKILLILSLLFTTNLYALDGGLSVVTKNDFKGLAIKAEILRIELLEGTRTVKNIDSTEAVKDLKKELNISIEPDFKVAQYSNIRLEVSPLVGVSKLTTTETHQSKLGASCDGSTNSISPSCFSEKTEDNVAFLSGASLKLDIEPDPKLHFYVKGGAYSNGEGYKPQASIGVTIPW